MRGQPGCVEFVCVLCYRNVSSEGLTVSVVFVCVLWYRNVSSEGLTVSVVFVCVLWYRNVSSEGADWVCCDCVCVMV